MNSTLRVGLLLDSKHLEKWQAKAVRKAIQETEVKVTEVVINPTNPRSSLLETVQRLIDLRAWAPIAVFKRLSPKPDQRKKVHIESIPEIRGATITQAPALPNDDFGVQLHNIGIAALQRTDVAILLGYGILLGDALDAPKYGILSFHHGDLTEYRGQPSGFWEFIHQEKTCGTTIQRINETLDGGEIIAYEEIKIEDHPTFEKIKADLLDKSGPLLVRALQNLQDDSFEPSIPENLGEIYSQPRTFKPVLKYLYLNSRGLISIKTQKLLGYR